MQLIAKTDSQVHLDPNGTGSSMFTRKGIDTRTYAWESVCPYTGAKVLHEKTYTYDGISSWQ